MYITADMAKVARDKMKLGKAPGLCRLCAEMLDPLEEMAYAYLLPRLLVYITSLIQTKKTHLPSALLISLSLEPLTLIPCLKSINQG